MKQHLPELIRERLARGFRSIEGHRAFESELSYGRYSGPAPQNVSHAAVILLLYPGADDWQMPLTLRPAHLRPHGGQISLPGGSTEGDESSDQTALRELNEELGVAPHDVEMLGRFSDLYIFASNYLVTPWVGVTRSTPRWNPQAEEVSEVLDVPIRHLVDRSNSRTSIRAKGDVRFRSPHIAFGNHEVWGATSMILGEFIALLRILSPIP